VEFYRWITLIIALSGAACNAQGLRWGFLFWSVSDISYGIADFLRGDYTRAFLQAVYVLIDISGFWFWGKKKVGRQV
jgi:nicotinamide riboside transporter PnuC